MAISSKGNDHELPSTTPFASVSRKRFEEDAIGVLQTTKQLGSLTLIHGQEGDFLLVPVTSEDLVPMLRDMKPDLFDEDIQAAEQAIAEGHVFQPAQDPTV